MGRRTIDFGIDLGTSNSTIAVIDGIDATVIPNKIGSSITPSAVWIDKRGSIHVGQEAKLRALVEDQDNADLEFKLRMGRGSEGKKLFARSGREMLPEELSAEVLKSLKIDVQTNMNEEIRAAVITVPAAFENPSTNATMKAAKLAGFISSPLLLEPVAASLAYGFQSESENVYWLVYDFGGGTFDAAVMRIRDGLIQVVNHDGDNFLGGKLIDWDIVDKKLAPALRDQFNLPDFRREHPRWKAEFGTLKYYAELAKIEVCRTKAPYEIWIEGLCKDTDGKEVDVAYTLTPQDVGQVSAPYIAKSLALCGKTLERSGLRGANLERILMVGGTTLNPWIREAVQAELGGQLEFGIDPVTVVARGAAIFASTQEIRDEERAEPVPPGTWLLQIEHEPVGNVLDPDIGGQVLAPSGQSAEGFTIEFVDRRTQWRSGRIPLGANGIFMTQLYAERQKRNEYDIEMRNTRGARIPTSPDRVFYTPGLLPEKNPPAAMTIGVGLANGGVATYIKKGTKLPFRKLMDHYTTIPLRAGHAEDELPIPLLEGEHPRAERNHGIGAMIIRGSDIQRDLPTGSLLEIALIMDVSQQIRVQMLIRDLDEDFDLSFDPQMKHNSLAELRKEVQQQKDRLTSVRAQAEETKTVKAKEVLSRIEGQELLGQIDSLSKAAETDPDAVAQLDRRVRELAAEVDTCEDAVKWPVLLEKAEASRNDTRKVVEKYGETSDRNQLRLLEKELARATNEGDPDLLRRSIEELDGLYFEVMDRQPGWHVARFNWVVDRQESMRDQEQAERLIAQGRRAINNNDVDALKATHRQLRSLLPGIIDGEPRHANIGGTITRE